MEDKIRLYVRKILEEQVGVYNNFSDLTEKDLYDIAKWGLMNDFSSSACWDDANDNLDVAAECAVQDFKNLLKGKFPAELGDFPDVATLYRFITLESPKSINKKALGKSWFSDPKTIDNTYFKDQLLHLTRCRDKTHALYLMVAEVPVSKVDIPRTLWQRSLTYVENEVVLKDDSNIKITALKKVYDAAEPIQEAADYANSAGDSFWGDIAGGILTIAKDTGKILVSYRSKYVNEPHTWGGVGGKVDDKEHILDAVKREFNEETKYSGTIALIPAYVFKSEGNTFEYHNYIGILSSEFTPYLDWETEKFSWVTYDELIALPNKHFGLKALLNDSKSLEIIKKYSLKK